MIIRPVAVAALQRQVNRWTGAARSVASRSNALFAKRTNQRVSMSTVAVPEAPTSNHAHTKLTGAKGTIIYTETDEAPALATYSLYPAVAQVGEVIDKSILSSFLLFANMLCLISFCLDWILGRH